jgi:hypothetical protein
MQLAFRQIQFRADNLSECLLIFELEMKRARTLEKRLEAYRDFARVVDRLDELRRDAEELLHSRAKEDMLDQLDRKAASIMRSSAYRVAEWFETAGRRLDWFISPALSGSFGN